MTPDRRGVRRRLALAAAALVGMASATSYVGREPTALVFAADLVFVAEVDTVRVVDRDGTPWTEVVFALERTLFDRSLPAGAGGGGASGGGGAGGDGGGAGGDGGGAGGNGDGADQQDPAGTNDRRTLAFFGGDLPGGARVTVAGFPRFEVGERVLVFAYSDAGLASPLVGVRQGLWRIRAAGLQDDDGSFLAVGEDGGLVRAVEGPGLEAVVDAIAALIANGPGVTEGLSDVAPADAPPIATEGADGGADGAAAGAADSSGTDAAPADTAVPDAAVAGSAEGGSDGGVAASDQAPAASGQVPAKTVTYVAEDGGGPLLLSTAAAEVAAAWTEATDGSALFSVDEGASNVVRYGDAALFGPDALSLTLARTDEAGRSTLEALIAPQAGDARRAALLHEFGVLLGLPEGSGGVMAFAVDPSASAPTAADVAAFVAQRSFVPEDLNRDGVVDFYDLEAFGRAFGASGVNLPADFDGSGLVDADDLERLRAAYQFTPPREVPPAP